MIRVAHADFAIHPDVPVLATEVGETSLTVALGQGGTVEVVVRDGLAAPAVGVDVLGDVVGDGARLIEPRVTTDASGIARYEHLTATRHQFRLADPPRSVGDSVQEVEVAAGETRVLHLTAPVKAWLEGRITEAGVALAGAKLHAVPGAPDDPESMIPWNEPTGQLTDTEGRFRIGPFEVGEWTLIVGHGSRALRDHVQVTVARDAPPVVIDLHVSEVAGTVAAPSGTPFAGEAVYAFRAMSETQAMNALLSGNSVDEERLKRSRVGLAWTDASGRYRLRGVPADAPIRVAAIPDTCQPALSPPFIVARGAVREGVDLAPLPGGRLEVRLTAPEEKRQMLRFHRVSAVLAGAESDDTAKRRVSTDSGGGALLRNLAPGVWTVEVTESFGDGVVAGPKPVTVKAGETATLAFEVP